MSNPNKVKLLRCFLRKFPRAILAIAEVCRAGDAKHNGTVRSYLGIENGHQEYSEAMVRHIFDEILEGPIDPEDGGLHAAKIACGAMFRLEIQLEKEHGEPVDYQYEGGPIGGVQKSICDEAEDVHGGPVDDQYKSGVQKSIYNLKEIKWTDSITP